MPKAKSARRIYLLVYALLFVLYLVCAYYWLNLTALGWVRYIFCPVFFALAFSMPPLARSVARLCHDFQSEKSSEELALDENYFPAVITPCRVQMFSMQEAHRRWLGKAGVFLLPFLIAVLLVLAMVFAGTMWFLVWIFYDLKRIGLVSPPPFSWLVAVLGFLTAHIIFVMALAAFLWKWRSVRVTVVSLDARGLSCLTFPNVRRPRLFAWNEIATCLLIVDRNSAGEDKTRIEIFNAAKKKLRVVRCGYVIPEERNALFAQLRYMAKK